MAETMGSVPTGGRKGSIVAGRYSAGLWQHPEGEPEPEKYASNEEVAKAVQQKVAAAVETSRKYRHVAWYSLFVAVYMIVLYLQASAYKSGDVVAALKQQFAPDDGGATMIFSSEDEVLEYLGTKVLLPIWTDPVCGDGICEAPWEYPAWGRFGCLPDCGRNVNTTSLAVIVRADFTGHPSISPRALMLKARWNLCLNDEVRRLRGEADLCWFDEDQTFNQPQANVIEAAELIDGNWYLQVSGDYAGKVSGMIYNLDKTSELQSTLPAGRRLLQAADAQPARVELDPPFEACKLDKKASITTGALRGMMATYTQAHALGGEAGRALLRQAVTKVSAQLNSMSALRGRAAVSSMMNRFQSELGDDTPAPPDNAPPAPPMAPAPAPVGDDAGGVVRVG